MKPYTCFFAAHGCCRSANSKGNSPLSGGHRGSGSTAVKKQPCPPLFYFFFTAQTSTEEAAQVVTACPPFLFFFSLVFFWQQAPGSHLCPAPLRRLLKHSRPPSRNGQNLPPVSVLFFFYYYWMMPRLPAQNGLCFFFIQQQQSGASCLSLGLRVAMATAAVQSVCPEDAHSGPVCVCEQLGANRAGPLYLPVCGGKHKRMTSAMKEPRVYGGCMSW